MRTAKVIEGEEQRQGHSQIFPLLAESVCQSGESSHLHSDGEVLTLNNRSADSCGVRIAKNHFRSYVHHNGWRVAMFVAFGGRVMLDELREVNILMLKLMNERIAILLKPME